MLQTPDGWVLDFKARIFKVIGDPDRLKILETLRHGEICQCELIPIIGQAQPTVSRHLKLIEDAGLISSHKDLTRMLYRVADSHIISLQNAIDSNMMELVARTGKKISDLTTRKITRLLNLVFDWFTGEERAFKYLY